MSSSPIYNTTQHRLRITLTLTREEAAGRQGGGKADEKKGRTSKTARTVRQIMFVLRWEGRPAPRAGSCVPLIFFYSWRGISFGLGRGGRTNLSTDAAPLYLDVFSHSVRMPSSRICSVVFFFFQIYPPADREKKKSSTPLQPESRFWGHNYLDLVWGGVWGLSPRFHVFSYASCVDLTQLLSQPNASWRVLRIPL